MAISPTPAMVRVENPQKPLPEMVFPSRLLRPVQLKLSPDRLVVVNLVLLLIPTVDSVYASALDRFDKPMFLKLLLPLLELFLINFQLLS